MIQCQQLSAEHFLLHRELQQSTLGVVPTICFSKSLAELLNFMFRRFHTYPHLSARVRQCCTCGPTNSYGPAEY